MRSERKKFNIYQLMGQDRKTLTPYQEKLVKRVEEALDVIDEKRKVSPDVSYDKSREKTKKADYAVNISVARLKLSGAQEQAEKDLTQGLNYIENGGTHALLGFKGMDLTKASGGAKDLEKMYDFMRKMMGRFHEWEFALSDEGRPHFAKLAKYMIAPDASLSKVNHECGISKATLSNWYKEALDKYCELFY